MIGMLIVLAQVAGAPAPTPAPTPTPASAPAPSKPTSAPTQETGARPATTGGLGAAAGKIKLNKNVSLEQTKAGTPLPAPTPQKPDGTGAKVGPGSAQASADATLEATWRARYVACRDAVSSAQAALEAAKAANPPVYNKDGELLVLAETQRNAAISPYAARLASAEADMARLSEDCRKAGCQPGWLRD